MIKRAIQSIYVSRAQQRELAPELVVERPCTCRVVDGYAYINAGCHKHGEIGAALPRKAQSCAIVVGSIHLPSGLGD